VELKPADGGQGGGHGRLNRREEGGNTRQSKAHQGFSPVAEIGVATMGSGHGVVLDREHWHGPTNSGAGPANHLACWRVLDLPWQGHTNLLAPLFQGTTQPGGWQIALMP